MPVYQRVLPFPKMDAADIALTAACPQLPMLRAYALEEYGIPIIAHERRPSVGSILARRLPDVLDDHTLQYDTITEFIGDVPAGMRITASALDLRVIDIICGTYSPSRIEIEVPRRDVVMLRFAKDFSTP